MHKHFMIAVVLLSVLVLAHAQEHSLISNVGQTKLLSDDVTVAVAPSNKQFSAQRDSATLTRVGNWPFGKAVAVAVDTLRQLVYLGSGGAVLVLDVSDVSNPQLISESINSLGLVQDLRYNHTTQHLYCAAQYEDFQIWDVQDPASPQQLVQWELPDPYSDPPVRNVDFYQHYAILECSYDYVNSVDVSNPSNPIWVDIASEMGNPARDIHVAVDGRLHTVGGIYYAVYYVEANGHMSGGGVHEFVGGAYVVFGTPTGVFIRFRNYLYILDATSPYYPVLSVTDVGYFADIVVQRDHAYMTVGSELKIYDVSDLENPFLEGSVALPSAANKLEVTGQYAYIAGGFAGLRIIDISDPTQPQEVGFYETFGATVDMCRVDDYAFLAELDDGMLVLDLADLGSPTLVGQFDTPGNTSAVEVVGNYAYVADGDSGLRIADVSDPLHPVEVGFYDSLNYAWRVAVSGDYAYVVDEILNEPDWIRIIDISDPASPSEVGSLFMQSDVHELDISGDYLYAAADDRGMIVLDVSDVTDPIEVGWFIAPDVRDVCVEGDFAYLASTDFYGGFVILDISEPTSPAFVSSYNRGGSLSPFDVAVQGDWAYVGAPTHDEMVLLYIGDPAIPRELGTFTLSGDISNIFALDSLVYISDGGAGLTILENELYSSPGGGITWEPQNSGTTEDLWSVYFMNASTGWAVGENGTIIMTDDGGETWQQQTSGTTSELFSVFFTDENTGWAVGRDGTIIHTTNGGNTWQPQTSGTDNVLRSIHFADADTGWTAGEDGTILYTTDKGNSWQPQTSGTNEYLTGIHFVDYEHGWVAVGGESGMILKTTDGGNYWQTINVSTQAYFYALYFVSKDTGWAAGTDEAVYKTTDGGDTWFEQTSDPTPYAALSSIYFVDLDNGWAVGYGGTIISTADGGDTWIEQISGIQNYLTSVYFVDQYHGWAAGKEGTILKAAPPSSSQDEDVARGIHAHRLALYSNYPNPFTSITTICYALPTTSNVTLDIYSILGEKVRTLVHDTQSPGFKSVVWDGTDNHGNRVSSGIYFYSLQSGNNVKTKKMVLLE